MKSYRFLILFLLLCVQAYPQSTNDKNLSAKIELIESVKRYCQDELNMDISKRFYSNWANSENPNYFLYVSKKDTLTSAFNQKIPFKSFGYSYNEAKIEKVKYDELEYSTLLYQTYGTSGAQLSNHLLSYSNESIAFIAFHEATHKHIGKNAKLPYSITEPLCDLVGNYGTLILFSEHKMLSKRKAKKQIKQIESVSIEINKLISNSELQNTNEAKIDSTELIKEIKKFDKKKNKFKIERYDYEINNAYLMRNKSYTKYYFKLKQLFILTKDLKEFLDFMIHLPNEEMECIKEIDKKIRTLSKSCN